MLRSSVLQTWITIQSRAISRNEIGEAITTWVDWRRVPAKVSPLRGAEFVSAAQVHASIDVVIALRPLLGLTADMRVLWLGAPYNIESIVQVDGKRDEIELMCRTGEARD